MPGEFAPVIRLHAHRAKLEGTEVPCRLPLAIQAAPGAVGVVLDEQELWLTPEQAFEVATDLWNAAREAKGG